MADVAVKMEVVGLAVGLAGLLDLLVEYLRLKLKKKRKPRKSKEVENDGV